MSKIAWMLFAFCLASADFCAAQSAITPQTEKVRLSEILISTPRPNDPAQVADAKRKADYIREAIRQGVPFASIARSSSQGPTAARGGDLGCFGHGKLAETLDALVFHMNVGDISDVIRTKQGFVILQVTARAEHPCSDLEVLHPGVSPELKPYVDRVEERVHQQWYKTMPRVARAPRNKQGAVTIEISLQRDGTISNEKVTASSGDADLDAAALKAINKARPFPPFPDTARINHVRMQFHFDYNPAKAVD